MTQSKYHMFIVAGETSGDILGGHLATALRAKNPELRLGGVGSQCMRQAGVDIVQNSDELSVLGLFEVIKHVPMFRRVMNQIMTLLKNEPPDLVILIDCPGLNLRLAKRIKQCGIKVMYYVSPQLWAWHYSRIKKIKKYVDHMAVLFPFEEEMYRQENIPVTFVGHPLVNAVKPTLSNDEAYAHFQLSDEHPIVALLPGSRLNEIRYHMPMIVEAMDLIKNKCPDVQFVLPLAQNILREHLTPYLGDREVQFFSHDNNNLFSICDVAITSSGTATLELALHQLPMVIIYKISLMTYLVGRMVIRVRHLGLCNLISKEVCAVELIQQRATGQHIADEVIKLLFDLDYRRCMLGRMRGVKERLGQGHAAEQAAQVALSMTTSC